MNTIDNRGPMLQAASEVAKATPPVTVTTFIILGHPISDWAVLATLVYTCTMLFVLVRDKIYKPYQAKKRLQNRTLKDYRDQVETKATEFKIQIAQESDIKHQHALGEFHAECNLCKIEADIHSDK